MSNYGMEFAGLRLRLPSYSYQLSHDLSTVYYKGEFVGHTYEDASSIRYRIEEIEKRRREEELSRQIANLRSSIERTKYSKSNSLEKVINNCHIELEKVKSVSDSLQDSTSNTNFFQNIIKSINRDIKDKTVKAKKDIEKIENAANEDLLSIDKIRNTNYNIYNLESILMELENIEAQLDEIDTAAYNRKLRSISSELLMNNTRIEKIHKLEEEAKRFIGKLNEINEEDLAKTFEDNISKLDDEHLLEKQFKEVVNDIKYEYDKKVEKMLISDTKKDFEKLVKQLNESINQVYLTLNENVGLDFLDAYQERKKEYEDEFNYLGEIGDIYEKQYDSLKKEYDNYIEPSQISSIDLEIIENKLNELRSFKIKNEHYVEAKSRYNQILKDIETFKIPGKEVTIPTFNESDFENDFANMKQFIRKLRMEYYKNTVTILVEDNIKYFRERAYIHIKHEYSVLKKGAINIHRFLFVDSKNPFLGKAVYVGDNGVSNIVSVPILLKFDDDTMIGLPNDENTLSQLNSTCSSKPNADNRYKVLEDSKLTSLTYYVLEGESLNEFLRSTNLLKQNETISSHPQETINLIKQKNKSISLVKNAKVSNSPRYMESK